MFIRRNPLNDKMILRRDLLKKAGLTNQQVETVAKEMERLDNDGKLNWRDAYLIWQGKIHKVCASF